MTLHAILAAVAVVAAAVSASTMHASPPLELLNATVVSLGEASFVAPMLSRLTQKLPLTIVAIGFATTLLELLSSPPDHVSSLHGVQLVAAKVERLVRCRSRRPLAA